jgi:hypothetical protein
MACPSSSVAASLMLAGSVNPSLVSVICRRCPRRDGVVRKKMLDHDKLRRPAIHQPDTVERIRTRVLDLRL